MKNSKEWFNQDPSPEEVSVNKDGNEFIPITIVETLLDELTIGFGWSTRNFQYQSHVYGTTLLISASVELMLDYMVGEESEEEAVLIEPTFVSRSLVGAVTFTDDAHGSNLNFGATALSECIKNAAKKLGNRFGKKLNERGAPKLADELVEKPAMDLITSKKYQNAIKDGDTKTQLEIENYYQV